MSTFNIRQLEDRARDVDPDLRYMALEDFQKNINDPKVQLRYVSTFIPTLFNLLSDSTTEVQNQAVKSFAPMVRHIEPAEIINVISRLYEEVNRASNTSKFTTSVPNLALRSIFNDSHSRSSKQLSRDVLDLLLPLLFASKTILTIDNIEILIDLIKNLGSTLTPAELSSMITSLVDGAYRESGIISKRSIMAIDCALQWVDSATSTNEEEIQFYDKVFADISNGYLQSRQNHSAKNICLTLFQVVLVHVKKAKGNVLLESSTQSNFSYIMGNIDLAGLSEVIDVEDLDIDVLVATNLVREDALITLSSLVVCIPYEVFAINYAASVVDTVNKAIVYDPFFNQGPDGYSDDEESVVDFSDDEEEIEQYEDGGENDGLAAKLRLQALVLLKHLIASFPQFITTIYDEDLISLVVRAINDKNDMVSSEAIALSVLLVDRSCENDAVRSRSNSDVSMTTEGNRGKSLFFRLCDRYASQYETQIFDYLLTTKNIGRFSNTKALIESLIVGAGNSLSDSFLLNLYDRLETFKLNLKVYPDLIRLYRVILSNFELELIPVSLLTYIIGDLRKSLNDSSSYHGFIGEVLFVCRTLFELVSGNAAYEEELNKDFFASFATNVNLKQLSSDVKQNLLSTLTSFVVNLQITPGNLVSAIEIYQESLNYEVTVNFTIENLVTVCNKKPELFSSPELCGLIVAKLNAYLSSSDASLYSSSLLLLDTIFEKTNYHGDPVDLISLSANIFDLLMISNDLTLVNKGLRILGHILDHIPADGAYFENLIVNVINTKFVDVDDVDLSSIEYLISQLTKHHTLSADDLFTIGMTKLTLKNFISSKILAMIALLNNLVDKVEGAQSELIKFAHDGDLSVAIDKIIFDIHFLGCISLRITSTKITFDDFFAILNSDANEQVCLAAARALGLCITRDLDKYLPTLLNCYLASNRDERNKGSLVLVSIKQVLKEDSAQEKSGSFSFIWNSIIQVLGSREENLVHADVAELRLAGLILSQVADLDKVENYESRILQILDLNSGEVCNEFMVYTSVVIIKQLLSTTNDDFNIVLIEKMLQFLSILNLELKQAIVSTLLTGIYNKSVSLSGIINDVILPNIYEELSAKEEFKKVIPMGPYKYVVDEGLEVRKLSFELLSAIISVDTEKMENNDSVVDQVHMFEVLLVKGLNDLENDIVNLTVLNLLQLIQNDENILTKITNQHELIASLTKVISKKLRSKASTQELESYENTLRSVIKLSKVINRALTNSNGLSSEWSSFYHEIKNKHHLLFSSMEQ